MNKEEGEGLQMPLENGQAVAAFSQQNLFNIKSTQFDRRLNRRGLLNRALDDFIQRAC